MRKAVLRDLRPGKTKLQRLARVSKRSIGTIVTKQQTTKTLMRRLIGIFVV